MDNKIRSSPEEHGLPEGGKVTESWVAARVAQDKSVKALVEELLDAQYDVDLMGVGKDIMEHRLQSLKILTELYKGNYFSAVGRSDTLYQASADAAVEKHRKMVEEGLTERGKKRPSLKRKVK